jgi:hypothetical protein
MGVGVRTRLRFVFPHAYMRGKEKFEFHIWGRNRDVARVGLGALACRRTDKPAYRPHQNYSVVYSTYWRAPPGREKQYNPIG